MALNKRVLDKIEGRCEGNAAMLDYMRKIVTFEFGESRQYMKYYEDAIKEFAMREDGGTR